MYVLRLRMAVRLQHRSVLRSRLRRSASDRRPVQPASGCDAGRRASQLGHPEPVAEARAARHATSGDHRPRVRRLRLRVASRLHSGRRLRLDAGGRRPIPALAADVGDLAYSNRLQFVRYRLRCIFSSSFPL